MPALAAAATTRVVAPGSVREETPCTAATPCQFIWALEQSGVGDTEQFESGEYPFDEVKGNPLTKAAVLHGGVTLERAPGDATRPEIVQSVAMPCNCSPLYVERNATIRDLEIEQLASRKVGEGAGALQIESGDTIERTILVGVEKGLFDNDIDAAPAELADDLVIGEDGAAVEATQGGTLQLDNDTVIGQGANGLGISAVDMNEPTSVVATNTIARGTNEDLEADISGSGSAAITLHHSDARKSMQLASGAAAKVTDTDHPIEGEPDFVSGSDFHEAPSSPTIDAGTADAASGALDLDGLPRTFGAAEDIGAYEFQGESPAATTGAASAVGQTTATLAGVVNPGDAPTSWYFRYGPTSAFAGSSPAQALAPSLASAPIAATIAGLAPGTTYHYELIAVNALGTATGVPGTFTTAAGPAGRGAPSDSALLLLPARFRAATRGATLLASSAHDGTLISYSDSQAATTTFSVLRSARGVRSGHACVAPPRHRRAGRRYKSCTRYVTVGSFTHIDKAGANQVRFSGRLHGHALAPRAYRLTATPRSAAGLSGVAVGAVFTIKR